VSYQLFTDGGSIDHKIASAACILTHPDLDQPIRLVSYLGFGTNNEAELFGVLMGFALVVARNKSGERDDLLWVADSDYSLKGLTEYIHGWIRNGWKTSSKSPVKNQGLWKAIYSLSRKLNLKTLHVRGHTGHPENELCDYAVNWIRNQKAIDPAVLELDSVVIDVGNEDQEWRVFDGQDWMIELREGISPEKIGERMILRLASLAQD
jgi:ribonuclease HI